MAKEKLTKQQRYDKLKARLDKLKKSINKEKKEKSKEWYKSVSKEFKEFPNTDFSKLADYLIRNKQAVAEKLGFIEKTEKQQ